MQSQYTQAVDYYGRAIQANVNDIDYAVLHKGICLGLLANYNQKISTLNEMLVSRPSSPLADNAAYEIAQAHVSKQEIPEAIQYLNKIKNNYPNSEIRGKAMAQAGILYYNLDQNDKAIETLQQTVREYPSTQESKDALTGLKNIYIDLNNVEGYTKFVSSLGSGAPIITISEEDSLTYISAENIYMTGDCEKSISSFSKYINKFPQGSFILNARFYRGDCNYQNLNNEQALEDFEFVIEQGQNLFTVQALLGAGRVAMRINNYDKAIQHYKKLAELSSSKGNINEAHTELMRACYYKGEYGNAQAYATQVLSNKNVAPEIERETNFIMAKSYEALGREVLALEAYQKVAVAVLSAEGAEANYQIAKIQFNRKEYDEAEKTVLNFVDQNPNHEYWIARSLILWADVFMIREDSFQALQTVQSIIDYYAISDDGILDLAKEKKEAYTKEQEKNEQPVSQENVEVEITD